MSNNFVYGSKSSKLSLKKALPFIGIGFGVIAVLMALILPSRIASVQKCNDLGLESDASTIVTGSCLKNFNEIVFVVGDTKNSPSPKLNFPDYIDTALNMNKATISAISVSNSSHNPKLVADFEDYKTTKKIKTASIEYIESMSAGNDGADYLSAIQTAARSVESKSSALVYVIGSGLSDRGLLNFADNELLGTNPSAEEIANLVAEKIDDDTALKGATIVWDGIGQTVAPQMNLDTASKKKLEDIYQETFKKLGAAKSNIRFKYKLNSEESVDTSKTVKPTTVTEEKIDFTGKYSSSETAAFQFRGDSSDFTDPEKTEAEIANMVNILKSHPSAKITITAYMSRGVCTREKVDEDLLRARLEAIKKALVAKGVSENRIILVSGGFGKAPECQNGVYNNEEGAKNRSVEIAIKN